ncbi:hypothetical protein EV645_0629 [Kribbella rubisoli]|uniref:Uncharacterized protein n=1 Tax=Kribbella rubisoli TaxID=3075929 RepID=A0A4Q7X5L1_9ACTN|nr:hypothetical protein EV645_0629 [Kribbella rubisoli]
MRLLSLPVWTCRQHGSRRLTYDVLRRVTGTPATPCATGPVHTSRQTPQSPSYERHGLSWSTSFEQVVAMT